VVRPIIDPVASVTSLERGDVDVLIGGHLPASPRVTRCTLFTENFVCVRDTKRAEGKVRLTKDDYARLPHVLFSSAGGDGLPGAIDTMLARHGRKRRTAVTLAHVVAVPFAVAGTDLVATMAERIARRFARAAGISVVPVPYDVEAFNIDLLHTRRAMTDPALRWLVELVSRVCKEI
jgi:DNA-binding transcriptional LysR family regulator